jgi:hypothetical protein
VKNSFSAIGQITNQIEIEDQKKIWFSLGLASVVLFSGEDERLEDELKKILNGKLSASEKWTIADNEIQEDTSETWLAPPSKIESKSLEIDYKSIENEELLSLLNEFALSINLLANLSAQYAPALFFTINSIVKIMQELINELNFLYIFKENKSTDNLPESLNPNLISALNEDGIQANIFQRIGAIVEIVSTISYIDSQLFSCVPPLINNSYRISSHSLLGVGSAYLGIAGFAQFVEKQFQNFPVTKVIENYFNSMEAFEHKGMYDYSIDKWDKYEFSLDEKFGDIEKNDIKSSLLYFSLRLGFKETTNTISIPNQVIGFADSVTWSIMTLSHELLHTHVRDILGVIFKSPENESAEDWFIKLCREYQTLIDGDAESVSPDRKNRHLIDSIRLFIFEYCNTKETVMKLGNTSGIGSVDDEEDCCYFSILSSPEDHINRLMEYYRDINELFVHVLDYHYFYDCKPEIYIGLLWESWSTVPSVLQDTQTYLLRTLIAIGTEIKIAPAARFEEAVSVLKENLETINNRCKNNVTIQKALETLADESSLQYLCDLFDTSIPLGDMVNKLLCSRNIYSSMVADPDRSLENGYSYGCETGIFENDSIVSPVAFILDRLKFSLERIENDLSIEYRSAWLLHVCASSLNES